jgi:tRNA threonylcarbamoyladenosine biosynthesis protein TsaB
MSAIAIDSASRDRAWLLRAADDGTVIEQRDMPGGQLDRLLPGLLAAILADDVTAVVVLTGPGSYSGVRAGMAAALGVAAPRGLPLHGLGNLAAIAAVAQVADAEEFSAVADAGRGGVYVARFRASGAAVEQVCAVERVTAAEIGSGPVFATAEIPGLRTERLDPVRVLAAAVPRALALPPLTTVGLRAVHVQAPATSR